jgi:CPA1 family monovalent cation:H+ antiporter
MLLAWIGPRGIVAAAVSVVFALRLQQLGVAGADLLAPLAFCLIIGTVVIQSATARPLAKWLGVTQPDTRGYLIIGANPVAIAVAKALNAADVRTVLADSDWEHVSAARMEGLQTYYGNPISNHADLHLETTGLGGMLGLSRYSNRNTAAALRFREEFGIRRIYTLASYEEEKSHEKHRASELYKGQILFGDSVRYTDLKQRLDAGAQIRATQLSDSYSLENWEQDNPADDVTLLFATDDQRKLRLLTTGAPLNAKSGWTLYSLRRPGSSPA